MPHVHTIRVGIAGANVLFDAVWDYHSIPLAKGTMFPSHVVLICHLEFDVWRIVAMDVVSNTNKHTTVLHSLTGIAGALIAGSGLPPTSCCDGHCAAVKITENEPRRSIFFYIIYVFRSFMAFLESFYVQPEMAYFKKKCKRYAAERWSYIATFVEERWLYMGYFYSVTQ